ncbi:Holliday junction branch migration protein RuvA [Phnomibacter ginsenosidimutans]|uniref:Holliday junction branch migration protein RuvA n=1 Tax=Phnomibacter ginsenosidimutans TaxID=2676868 RepID=UPI001FEB8E01|nr:Holliday junction branch migration protein RuvA [Phnomibacter ginsenosidimutans]
MGIDRLALPSIGYFRRMISQLTGRFLHKTPTRVVVDVQGVGYELQISLNTYSDIQAADSGTLHTYLKVAEDAFTLYGFSEMAEREVFLKLISVSGVGAGTARMMLNSMKPVEVAHAISTGQVKTLEAVKGIGKKNCRTDCAGAQRQNGTGTGRPSAHIHLIARLQYGR